MADYTTPPGGDREASLGLGRGSSPFSKSLVLPKVLDTGRSAHRPKGVFPAALVAVYYWWRGVEVPMVKFVTQFRYRYKAIKNADKITRLLLPAFVPFFGPERKLHERMQADEFLISYMYGFFAFMMIEACGIADNVEKALTLLECYDRFFPGEGKRLVDLCNSRIEANDESFLRVARKAYEEMSRAGLALAKISNPDDERTVSKELKESGVDISWPSLRKHLVKNYLVPRSPTET
jgi:hypothetical protein